MSRLLLIIVLVAAGCAVYPDSGYYRGYDSPYRYYDYYDRGYYPYYYDFYGSGHYRFGDRDRGHDRDHFRDDRHRGDDSRDDDRHERGESRGGDRRGRD